MRDQLVIQVASADTARRLIEGVAVPYGETAEIGWSRYRFAPGSLRLARAHTPGLLGHDTNRPFGIVSGLDEAGDSARVIIRADRTPDGDVALEQARSGSRSGLSIGFEVDAYTEAEGVIEVTAASVYEVSLVAVAAFEGAQVERVAAERSEDAEEPPADDPEAEETAADEAADPDDDPEEGADDVPPEQQEIPTEAARRPVIRAERPRTPQVRPGAFVQAMIRAERGDVASRELVTAALSAVTTALEPGVMPITYTSEILGGVDQDRTLFDVFRSSAPLPENGMKVQKPKWTVRPEGGWIVDGAPTPSNAATIDSQEATIEQWAYGIIASYALVDRSSPDFTEAIYRGAIEDYWADVEQKIVDEITASLAAPSATLGAAVAAFVAARKTRPNVLLVSGDTYGDYLDATGPQYPLYTTGAVDAGGGVAEYIAGLRLVLAPSLPAGSQIVAHTSALDVRESSPIRLSAQVIGTNSVELGVYSFALFDTEKADCFYPVGPTLPLSGRSSKASS